MALTKVLIAVKTYPTLSEKYEELVCTAGFREDGTWIRIYPVQFRKLDYVNQYKKWQWIELDLVKNISDFRPESFRPYSLDTEIRVLDAIGTENGWAKRKEIVFKKGIHDNLSNLIESAKADNELTSLAVVKPKEVKDFIWESCERDWDPSKLARIEESQKQFNLFDETKKLFTVAKKLPYKFSYIFKTEDNKERTLMIEDWELGQLYWNCLKTSNNDEELACRKVKQKYFNEFLGKDLFFFLGTTRQYHKIAPNPFIIIGAFYPPKEKEDPQLSLF